MQNVYQRIGKSKFRFIVILIILATDFRWAGVLQNLLKNTPLIMGHISQADQSQLGVLIDRTINLGIILILGFQAFVSVLFLLEKWKSRQYFTTYSAISALFLCWNTFYDYDAILFVIAHGFIGYGLFHWKTIYENLEPESLSAMEESNPAKEHSHS